MNKIEKMYWDGLVDYFKTFNTDVFSFQEAWNTDNKQLSVKYSKFNDGLEYGDNDEVVYETPASVNIDAECSDINFNTGYSSTITLMFGNSARWRKTVGNYEPDFIFEVCDENSLGFAIEIDGFDYHDKTKEQAAKDKQRDRLFLKKGYIPIRFAGTEVYRNPLDCVRETMQIIMEIATLDKKRDSLMESHGYYLAAENKERA